MGNHAKNVRLVTRRDTSNNWVNSDAILLSGELALETDTGMMKAGNGVDLWTNLPYLYQDGGVIVGATGAVLGDEIAEFDNKRRILIPQAGALFGLVKSSNQMNQILVENDGTMTVNGLSIDKVHVLDGQSLVLDAGTAKEGN